MLIDKHGTTNGKICLSNSSKNDRDSSQKFQKAQSPVNSQKIIVGGQNFENSSETKDNHE